MGKTLQGGGYISRELFERLYRRGIKPATRLKKNMKNKLMEMEEKVLLRKRTVIESATNFLKNIRQEEHPPNRAQPALEFYQFYSESSRGVVSLQFFTA
jgi:hypothetical protein